MNLWQAFKMAFKSIAMKKTRSFLTMLGIIIGVASVVIMVSVMQGQAKKNMEYFEKMGDNKITLYAYSYYDVDNETGQKIFDYCLSLSDLILGITPNAEINDKGTVQYGSKVLPVNDWEALATPMPGGGMMMDGDTSEKMLRFKLGSESYGVCNNYTLAGGREFTYLEVEKTLPVCVLGSSAKEQIFGYTDPVGETISINGDPFQVVGWYNSMDLQYSNGMDSAIVIPYTFNRSMNKNNSMNQYVIKAKDGPSTIEATTRIDAFLNGMFPKNADGWRENGDYNVGSDDSWMQDAQKANLMQSLVMGAIAGISLLVGGIGIMNIMLVTVTERTREIGIRKAIGAERSSIITQFL
ncbi:MAG: multidrug ABC transporter permease, partial [Lawsonibacter sp.]|nr:multidrug ABC transporter permease [Lawsonibacter sp.]